MAIRTEQVSLDIQPCCDARGPVVCGRQGDEGTVLNVTVTQNGQAMPLDGLTATLLGNNPELLQLAGTVSGSTATFTLPSAFFSAACIVRLYVQLAQGSDVVASTQTFTLKVAPGADLSASQAQGYVTQLDEALATAKQASQTAEAAATQATQAVDDANTALQTANTAVQNANTAADAANAAASNANAAALAARGNVLKGTVTDASVAHVEDAYAGAVAKEIRVMGKTRQNLWVNPDGYAGALKLTSQADGSLAFSGSVSGNDILTTNEVYILKHGQQYHLSKDLTLPDGNGFFVQCLSSGSWSSIGGIYGSNAETTVTIPEDSEYARFGFQTAQGTSVAGTVHVMLNEGNTSEPWCPPGLTSVSELDVVMAGKNLVSIPDKTVANGFAFNDVKIPRGLDGRAVTLSFEIGGAEMPNSSVNFRDAYANVLTEEFINSQGPRCSATLIVPDGTASIGLWCSNSTPTTFANVQLELGSQATAYEPPSVISTPIDLDGLELRSLPDGTRDVLTWDGSGAVSVEQAVKDVFPTLKASQASAWQKSGMVNGFYTKLAPEVIYVRNGNNTNLMCDKLPILTREEYLSGKTGILRDGAWCFCVPESIATDASGFVAWLAQQDITLIGELIEHQTTDLPSATMPALPESTANVWASCDPPTELDMTYERDLTLAYNELASKVAALTVAQATN